MGIFGVLDRHAVRIGLTSRVAIAHAGHGGATPWHHDVDFYDYGDVMRVEPIIRMIETASPREVCWDEEVAYYEPSQDTASTYTSTIVGGIVGGIVGNQFGKETR